MQKDLGNFLKNLRVRNGYTQKELADILIVTPQTVSKWELNNSTPSLDILLELSNLYGITTDEIIKTELVKRVKEEKYFSIKNVSLYLIYTFMFAIGILLNFVDYFTVNKAYLENGLLDIYTDTLATVVEHTMIIDNYLIRIGTIFIPLFFLVLKLIDKKKQIYLFISTLFGLVNLVFLLPTLYSTYFIRPEIGIVLHMIYTLLVFLSSLIVMSEIEINLYKLLEERPLEIAASFIMFIIAVVLPFGFLETGYYWNSDYPLAPTGSSEVWESYYFSFSEYFLLFIVLVTPIMLIFKDHRTLKKLISIYTFAVVIMLLFLTPVYLFNSGLLLAGVLLYSYIVCIGMLYKSTIQKANVGFNRNILPISLYFIEGISFITYIYLFLMGGDLFSRLSHTVHFRNMEHAVLAVVVFIALLISMMFRYSGLKKASRVSYLIFTLLLVYFTNALLREYFLVKHTHATDGILFLVPPILFGLFYFIHLIKAFTIVLDKKDVSYLNPFKGV